MSDDYDGPEVCIKCEEKLALEDGYCIDCGGRYLGAEDCED